MDYGRSSQDAQRPYKGYAAHPPTARDPPQQQHSNNYDDGYHQGQTENYGKRPQPGPYPGRGGPMPPRGRGGPPMGRPPPGRGGPPPARGYGPSRGRGGPPPGQPGKILSRTADLKQLTLFQGARRPPPGRGGYGHPTNHAPSRMQSQDDYMSQQMSSMNIDGNRRPHYEDNSSYDGYGATNQNGRTYQQDYDSNSLPAGSGNGYAYDNDYSNGSGARNEFGPPSRSLTTPARGQPHYTNDYGMGNGTPYGQPPPPRPSTTTGTRPGQQNIDSGRLHPYGNGSDGHRDQSAVSLTDVVDAYYDSSRNSGQDQGSYAHANQPSLPNFDAAPQQGSRDSLEQASGSTSEQPHRGAHQVPQFNHAHAFANVPEPQSAVFEMVGDTPSVPPMPSLPQSHHNQSQSYDQSYNQGYNASTTYNQLPLRGPSAPPVSGRPPPPASGYAVNPGISRPGTAAPQRSGPGSLPSHPTPVRPGLMPNSLVNPNDKPPPVRNYGGVANQQQQYNQQAPPPPQQARQYDMPPVPPPDPNLTAVSSTGESLVSTQELEQLRMVIKTNPNDQVSALKLAKRLIEASDTLASNIPDPRARAKARERYLVDAHKILKKLASAHNVEAMFTLADNLGRGTFGYEPDSKEAFTLYQSAAKMGHAAAAYRTAVCCEIGHEDGGGTRKDPLKAMQWYKRAATLGDPPAMYKIGMILLKGLLGQPRNPREAVQWLKRAAERADAENPHALHELGLLYESAQPSDAILRDEGYAFSLFQQAAELGYKFSQFRLGCVYEYGLMGFPIDPRLSIVWYSRAAMQEEHQSELALSGWYLTGTEGVLNQSDTEAYLWARKAAVAGLAKAEYAMGYFTEVGIGIAPNLEDAKRWYWRAAGKYF